MNSKRLLNIVDDNVMKLVSYGIKKVIVPSLRQIYLVS